jgi:hypothetical protein
MVELKGSLTLDFCVRWVRSVGFIKKGWSCRGRGRGRGEYRYISSKLWARAAPCFREPLFLTFSKHDQPLDSTFALDL